MIVHSSGEECVSPLEIQTSKAASWVLVPIATSSSLNGWLQRKLSWLQTSLDSHMCLCGSCPHNRYWINFCFLLKAFVTETLSFFKKIFSNYRVYVLNLCRWFSREGSPPGCYGCCQLCLFRIFGGKNSSPVRILQCTPPWHTTCVTAESLSATQQ